MANDQFVETFKEEALELLGSLESSLLELEENPTDPELLSAVFRVMHTIKGSAAMFGLDQIAAFGHEVESILSALREGQLSVSRPLIDNTLIARDKILEMLENPGAQEASLSPELTVFLDAFRQAVGFSSESAKPEIVITAKKNPAIEEKKTPHTWYIKFKPGKDIFRRGSNPLTLLSEIKSMGEMVCIPNLEQVPVLASLDSEDCLVGWEIFLTSTASENEIRDVFIFVEDCSEILVEAIADLSDDSLQPAKKLGEILIKRGKIQSETLDTVLNSQRRIGEILVQEKLVSPTDLKIALEEQKQLEKVHKNKMTAADMSTIRVKSEKLDELMSLVGELVTVHARVLETSKLYHSNDELSSIVEQFGRLTDELRNNTMSIRMVPLGTTFSSFKRLVRDLSAELGKNVELETVGGETELDKTIIEKLNDPLIHIIRNSLDHGVEEPEIRAERGKPETGTIRLSATQTGASVYITIEDDGNGLNTERIRAKAIERGIIKAEDTLTDSEVYKIIFAPGFSTKENVTSVSGRGVGMDVVNRQMELINGTITIESKEKEYTRIVLKIPLTLAIIEGLLVRVADEFFVIPLAVVLGCLEFVRDNQQNENNIVVFHDRQLPFVNLRAFFSIPGERQAIEQIVVVNIKNQHVGILVDQVIGGNQTVIKPLGKLYKRADGVSSATILGDGSVALIMDIEQIIDATEKAET